MAKSTVTTTEDLNAKVSNPLNRRKYNVPTAESPLSAIGTAETSGPLKVTTSPMKPQQAEESAVVSDRDDVEEEELAVAESTETKSDKPAGPVQYTDAEVLPILDSLLNNGYAIHTFKLRNVEIILRTRFTWEEQYVYQHLEAANCRTSLNYQMEYGFITLASSLVKYGDSLFNPINAGPNIELQTSIKQRYDYVMSMNTVVLDIMRNELGKFDDKQRYIIDNFDKLLKSF